MGAEVNLGTVYDFNKQAMKNEKPLDPIMLNKKVNEVAKWMFDAADYFMLLSNENKDYTVFNCCHSQRTEDIAKEILACLNNRGQVTDVTKQEDGNYEIWLRIDGEDFVYYIFNYSWGIIDI